MKTEERERERAIKQTSISITKISKPPYTQITVKKTEALKVTHLSITQSMNYHSRRFDIVSAQHVVSHSGEIIDGIALGVANL